ncbi:hypothetical protein [uncultured Sulfitobacter sp.]|uniref:hypothetical protein n=1 Tax=uncultured Sulfitobacter sp. TaxID=191468 RepID=UPI00262BBBFC|nr:hypothetical protein [uncultured Sulfitobacter sp.]
MRGNVLKIIVGVVVGGFLVNAIIGLGMVAVIQSMMNEGAYVAPRKEVKEIAGTPVVLPELSVDSDLSRPIVLNERAVLSLQLSRALGVGTDGWQLRYNTKEDGFALRPDLAECMTVPYDTCKFIIRKHDAEVFVKGDYRLFVQPQYYRKKLFRGFDRGDEKTIKARFPKRRWTLLNPDFAIADYLETEWVTLEPWNGFNLERMENHGGNGAYFLRATLEGDGKLTLDMMTNAPLEEVKAQLAEMDLDLLRAMVVPVPFGGFDTLDLFVSDVLEDRLKNTRYLPPSDEELLAKVAQMSPRAKTEHFGALVRAARLKRASIFDFDVLYRADEDQGLQDTRDFLAGLIEEDDVRYDVLNKEHKQDLRIGSCVATQAGTFCKDNADAIRIIQELRRQVADVPEEPVAVEGDEEEPQYTEELFQRDMREIERQVATLLAKLGRSYAAE